MMDLRPENEVGEKNFEEEIVQEETIEYIEEEFGELEEYYEEEVVEQDISPDTDCGRVQLADDAPTVDLNILVLENHGLEVVYERQQMGLGDGEGHRDNLTASRIIRSTCDLSHIPLYTPILRERPALVCQQQDYLDYLERFLDASTEIQLGVLDMFYQPLDSQIGRSLIESANMLFLLGLVDDLKLIHQLLCIYVTNGHQYRDKDQAAMAIFGSKFSHSCHPNAAYSSMSEDGCLEYLTIQKNIRKGDEVTLSYLSDLYESPTSERRDILWQTKSFMCTCRRCLGPDYCRCLNCPICEHPVLCRYKQRQAIRSQPTEDDWLPSEDFEAYWECLSCSSGENNNNDSRNTSSGGTEDDERCSILFLLREKEVASAIRYTEQRLKSQSSSSPRRRRKKSSPPTTGDSEEITTIELQELVDDACETLSSVHHLTVKALRLLAAVSVNQTYKLITRCAIPERRNVLEVSLLLRTSILAGIQIGLAGECVASNCTGCYRQQQNRVSAKTTPNDKSMTTIGINGKSITFNVSHDPLYDRSTPMRHVVEDLVQLSISFWPSQALFMVQRYQFILRAKFRSILQGPLQILSQCWDEPTTPTRNTLMFCRECGTTYWTGRIEG